MPTPDLLDDLMRQIRDRKVVVVLGTGVSMAASGGHPCAGWVGLLKDGLERVAAVAADKPSAAMMKAFRAELKKKAPDVQTLIEIASVIESRLGAPDGPEFGRWLAESVGAISLTSSALLQAIGALGAPILSTNYDELAEDALGRKGTTWRVPALALRVLRRESDDILHLHGHVRDPASVVLGAASYDRVVGDEASRAMMAAMAATETILFIGCGANGLTDPDFSHFLRWFEQVFGQSHHRHYLLCRTSECGKPQGPLTFLPYGPNHADLLPFLHRLAPPPSHTLPPIPDPFLGRNDQVDKLAGLITGNGKAVVMGGPGIGKSSVAIAALHRPDIAARFGARRWFVALDGANDTSLMLAKIGEAMGLPVSAWTPNGVRPALAEAPALLVLDNLETPLDRDEVACKQELDRLATIPGLAVVLAVRSHTRPRPWPDIDLDRLDDDDARALFLAWAGNCFATDPNLGLLLKLLDGVPLALRLMGCQAEAEGDLPRLMKQWKTERETLLALMPGDRLHDLGASIGLSLSSPRMTPETRDLLSLLGVLPNGIALGDLETVLPGAGSKAARQLFALGLAERRDGRLTVLAPIREIIALRLEPEPAILAPCRTHYLSLATAGAKLGRKGGDEAAARLAPEAANVEAILAQTLPDPDHGATAMPAILGYAQFCRFTGIGEPLVLLQTALTIFDNAGTQAHCLLAMADVTFSRSQTDETRVAVSEAQSLFRQDGNRLGEAACAFTLGQIARQENRFQEARQFYDEALIGYQAEKQLLGQANCHAAIAGLAQDMGEEDAARRGYDQAAEFYHNANNQLGEANCICALGEWERRNDRLKDARDKFDRALVLYRILGDSLGIARALHGLAELARQNDETTNAHELTMEALAIFRKVGNALGEGHCLINLGEIAGATGNHITAREYFTQALARYRDIGSDYSIGRTLINLALIAQTAEERRRLIREAHDLWAGIDHHNGVTYLKTTFPDDLAD